MCTLKELRDGTYNLYDLEMFHQIIELKSHSQARQEDPELPEY